MKNRLHNFVIWERPAMPGIIYLPAKSCVLPLMKNFGRPWGTTYCFFENGMIKVVFYKKEMENSGKFFAENFLNKKYFKNKIAQNNRLTKNLLKILKQLKNTNLKKLKDDEFLELFNKFNKIYLDWWGFVQVIEPLALGLELLFKDKKKITQKEFNTLTAPTQKSYSSEIEAQLLKTAKKFLQKKNIQKDLKRFEQKYYWMNNGFNETKYLTSKYFESQIKKLTNKRLTVKTINNILQLNAKHSSAEKLNSARALKQLKFTEREKRLVCLIKYFTNFQDERKALTLKTNHFISLLIKDLAGRIKTPYKDTLFILPQEYPRLFDKTFSFTKIKKRKDHFSLIFSKKGLEILEGKKSKKRENKLLGKIDYKIRELEGMSAMGGKITGKVRIILDPKKSNSLKKGEILVTTMTSPDFITAIKKAKAIITDEGGITSHAAIISRELGIPCIIATKLATRILKDGDKVEVNANHGFVKKI